MEKQAYEKCQRRADDPLVAVDEVVDEAEFNLVGLLAGMLVGAVLALSATWAFAVLMLSFERMAP